MTVDGDCRGQLHLRGSDPILSNDFQAHEHKNARAAPCCGAGYIIGELRLRDRPLLSGEIWVVENLPQTLDLTADLLVFPVFVRLRIRSCVYPWEQVEVFLRG